MRFTAEVTLKNAGGILYDTIRPELEEELPRTRAEIRRRGDSITIKISAEDASALRAALNSYLQWLRLAEDIGSEISRKGSKKRGRKG